MEKIYAVSFFKLKTAMYEHRQVSRVLGELFY